MRRSGDRELSRVLVAALAAVALGGCRCAPGNVIGPNGDGGGTLPDGGATRDGGASVDAGCGGACSTTQTCLVGACCDTAKVCGATCCGAAQACVGGACVAGACATGYVPGSCTPVIGCNGAQVAVVAGDGTYGFQNGNPGQFRHPQGIAADPQGQLYIADSENNAVRAVDPAGNVTTLAGDGDAGFADGPAAGALFNYPTGVAVGDGGAVYVADQGNHRIRVVAAGAVRTLAGDGDAGFVEGTGGATGTAEFDNPTGVAVDGTGRCVVADTGNRRIRVIDPAGNVTTLAQIPNGLGPNGVALDGNGNVYTTDGTQVFKVTPLGAVSVFAGTTNQGFQDGPAASSLWSESLYGIAADQCGYVYVADYGNALIRRIDPYGYVVVVAGKGDGGIAGSGGISGSSSVAGVGLALDPAGNLVTLDEGHNQVARIQLGCAPSGMPQVCCGCGCTVLATGQTRPSSIAVDATNLYWSNFGSGANSFEDGAIYQMPKGGGPIVPLATGQALAGPVAVDTHNVYWTAFYSGCDAGCPPGSGTVNQVPIGGGAITALATGQPLPFNVAVDQAYVYWSNQGGATADGGNAPASIWAVPIGGTSPAVELVPGGLETSVGQGGGLVVNNNQLYWSGLDDAGASAVYRMSKDGGQATLLASGQFSVVGLEVDSVSAYFWSRQILSDGGYPESVWSVPLTGAGAAAPLVQNTLGFPAAQDAAKLYLVDFDEGLVQSVPKSGAAMATNVCSGQINPQWAARDANHLYWVLYGSPGDQGGMVVSLPLP